mmetsp:Transcript_8426/g.28904  ORF Transcript_8426/g.28904 Transcript_8426/m.28904 type:complete len:317 (+) Transcript_8426:1594-2544(+)
MLYTLEKMKCILYFARADREDGRLLLVHELSGSLVHGGQREEDDGEEQEGLGLGERDAGLHVELGEGPLAGHGLSDERGGKPELRHASDEQLVGLGEPDSRNSEELSGVEDGDGWVLKGSRGPVHGLLGVRDELSLAGRERGEEVEGGEAKNQGLGVEEREAGLDVELREGALAGQDLAHQRRSESQHGHASHEELVRLGEPEAHVPNDVLPGLEELSRNADLEGLRGRDGGRGGGLLGGRGLGLGPEAEGRGLPGGGRGGLARLLAAQPEAELLLRWSGSLGSGLLRWLRPQGLHALLCVGLGCGNSRACATACA